MGVLRIALMSRVSGIPDRSFHKYTSLLPGPEKPKKAMKQTSKMNDGRSEEVRTKGVVW